MERKYMMYEGEETNSIDLLYETPTVQANGVKVIIPIKNMDVPSFVSKMKEQLAYFENVYFDTDYIDNEFKIYRSEHFQMSELCSDSKVHVCLDNVYYPLDFDKLGIDPIKIPLGLKFSLTDGIFPTPNREALRYSTEAKATILEKIKIVANHLQTAYNATVEEFTDVFTIYNYYNTGVRRIRLTDKQFVDVASISKFTNIPEKKPILKDSTYFTTESLYKLTSYMMSEYNKAYRIDGYSGRFNEMGSWHQHITFSDVIGIEDRKVYVCTRKPSDIKKKWLKSTVTRGSHIHIFKKVSKRSLFPEEHKFIRNKFNSSTDYSCYYDLLALAKLPVNEWRAKIQEYQSYVSEITKHLIDLDAFEVPQSFIDANKPVKVTKYSSVKTVKMKGDISLKVATSLEKYVDGRNCKFVPTVYTANILSKLPHLVIYGLEIDREKLDKWWCSVPESVAKFAIVSEREKTRIESYEMKQWMYIDDFLKGDNKVIKRVVSASLINHLYKDNSYMRSRCNVNHVLNNFNNDVPELVSYEKNNIKINSPVHRDLLEDFEKRGIVDGNIHHLYLKYKNFIDKHSFFNTLSYRLSSHSEDIKIVTDMCRYHKIRMNKGYYKITEGWQPVDENGQLFLFDIVS